ncbi:DEAD/DEAH box helicase [Naasia lichenicola]|uniref:DEAD/DEAH box helicase n=1 Tax=Naasia lichenicola TaxID=2565933 RepID=UPI00130DD870|nr:DEAD/DEAH box helicase [Naasia lichenicola]
MFTDADIRALTGSGAFARGETYAREGHFDDIEWEEPRRRLLGRSKGSHGKFYRTTVNFEGRSDSLVPTRSTCSCPQGSGCKHVAGLLLTSRRLGYPPETLPGALGSAATSTPSQMQQIYEAAQARAATVSTWRRQLEPLLEKTAAPTARGELGVQFELHSTLARGTRRAFVSLLAHAVRMGERGLWVRSNINWADLQNAHSSYVPWQVDAMLAIRRALQKNEPGWGSSNRAPLALEDVPAPGPWQALRAARDAGVVFIASDAAQSPVRLSDELAKIEFDVATTSSGLAARTRITLAGDELRPRQLGLVGFPTSGLYTWNGDAATPSEITLAAFERPLSSAERALTDLTTPVEIPADEVAEFTDTIGTRLSETIALTSSDDTFTLPERRRPRLGVTVEHLVGLNVRVSWHWIYATDADANGAVDRQRVSFDATSGRDGRAEAKLWGELPGGLGRWLPKGPLDGPGSTAFYAGMSALSFVAEALPVIRTIAEVEDIGEPTDYKAAEAPPEVTFTTVERPDDRDWFDLEITVLVDGEEIPFAEVFLALDRGDDYLVLPGGVYAPLTGPRFDRLRELISEAKRLDDTGGEGIALNRYQTALWDDLAEVGVLGAQAKAWQDSVRALSGGEPPTVPLPAGFTAELRGYQQTGFDWLSFLYDAGLGGVLADDMGLGKTVQALAMISHTAELEAEDTAERGSPPRPFLVVAPTSVLPNWVSEAKRFAPNLTVAMIDATSAKSGVPLATQVDDADIIVTSYALVRLDEEQYAQLPLRGVLFDEAQFLKNRRSIIHRVARELRAPVKFALTGTPLENSLTDLWSILAVVAPGLFPSIPTFTELYLAPIERDNDRGRLAQLRRRIRPLMLRRTKEHVASELPPKQEQVLELELGPEQRRVYDTILARERRRVLGLMDEFSRNRMQIFRALTLLRQAALDASLIDQGGSSGGLHELDDEEGAALNADIPSAKLDVLEELLADALEEDHRVLIFSQFTRFLGKVKDRLDASGTKYAYLDGRTRKRGEQIDLFRSGEVPVFLISLKAGGFGLNLAEADYCILLDPWWNPAAEAQAIDRAHRIGQTNTVHVYRLVAADTIEQRMMALKQSKAELFSAVMSGEGDAVPTQLTADDIRSLLDE